MCTGSYTAAMIPPLRDDNRLSSLRGGITKLIHSLQRALLGVVECYSLSLERATVRGRRMLQPFSREGFVRGRRMLQPFSREGYG